MEEIVNNREDIGLLTLSDDMSQLSSLNSVSFESEQDDTLIMKTQEPMFSTQTDERRERVASFFLLFGRWA